jgi:predicted Fe-Mo cluster-binding NifX family protein
MARKIAITAQDRTGADALLEPRFGRAPFFELFDEDSGEVLTVIDNQAAEYAHGAGTGAATTISQSGASIVISGRFGPKAAQSLAALGVETWIAPEGVTVGEALVQFKAGQLERGGGRR